MIAHFKDTKSSSFSSSRMIAEASSEVSLSHFIKSAAKASPMIGAPSVPAPSMPTRSAAASANEIGDLKHKT